MKAHRLILSLAVALGSALAARADPGAWVQLGPTGVWQPTLAGAVVNVHLDTAESNGGPYVINLTAGPRVPLGGQPSDELYDSSGGQAVIIDDISGGRRQQLLFGGQGGQPPAGIGRAGLKVWAQAQVGAPIRLGDLSAAMQEARCGGMPGGQGRCDGPGCECPSLFACFPCRARENAGIRPTGAGQQITRIRRRGTGGGAGDPR